MSHWLIKAIGRGCSLLKASTRLCLLLLGLLVGGKAVHGRFVALFLRCVRLILLNLLQFQNHRNLLLQLCVVSKVGSDHFPDLFLVWHKLILELFDLVLDFISNKVLNINILVFLSLRDTGVNKNKCLERVLLLV